MIIKKKWAKAGHMKCRTDIEKRSNVMATKKL